MAIVDVWLTTGQSQMVGLGNGQDSPSCDPDLCWEWNGGLPLVTVDDPESSSPGDYRAQTGSSLPKFAKDITIATGRPSVIVRAAIGGTALLSENANANGDWSPTGTLFDASVTRALAAIADIQSLGHTIGDVHVLWSQGYADAIKGNNLESYQAANGALVSRWRTALSRPSLKVYIELMYAPEAAPSQTVKDRCLYIRDAQLASAEETPGMMIAFNEGGTFADRGWLNFDNLHYNQAGLNYMGQRFAEYIANDLGLTPAPPQIERSPTSALARMLLGSDPVYGTPTFIVSGEHTWKVPGGITSIGGEAIGAGAGGGGGTLLDTAGGGGGGAYAGDPTIAVTPFETLTIVVGTAGTGGLNGNDGTSGTPSGIKRGETWLLKADAGLGGRGTSPYTGGSAGLAANCVGETTTSGTDGTTGGGGIHAHGGAAASGGTLVGGAGGVGNGNTTSNPANSGDTPGGGGAGKLGTNGPGGGGGNAVVKIILL